MASPVKAPDVLPPDFNQWDQSNSPDVLPPDFFDKQDQTASVDPRNKLQRAFDDLTTVTPEQEKGHSWLTNKAQEFGAGAIGSLSPLVHPVDAIKGIGNTIAHPINTAKAIGSEVMEHPAQAAGGLVGGAVTGGLAAEAGAPLIARIPTKAKAGQLFEAVAKDAANQPVSLARAEPVIQKILQLGREGGGTVPVPVRQLANTINAGTPKSVPILRQMQNDLSGASEAAAEPKPLLYPSARNFQSGLSSLSRADSAAMGGPMKGQLKQLNKAFFGDVNDAASAAGRGDEYVRAMRMHRQAARIADAGENLKKIAIPATAGALGAGGVYKIAKALQQ